jgi:hypothetical protein
VSRASARHDLAKSGSADSGAVAQSHGNVISDAMMDVSQTPHTTGTGRRVSITS